MSRKEAFDSFSLSECKESMAGIYTTSVARDTIDEWPMVYKPMEEIISRVKETVTIDKIIKPIYNFKASEKATEKRL